MAAMLAVVLSSCSNNTPRTAAPAPTTVAPATSSSSPPSSPPTAAPSTTTTGTPRSATTVAMSPEGFARALYDAWTRGDRTAAEKVAAPEAVTALFARAWQASDGWTFSECSGAAGSLICTWQRSAGQQVLFRVRNLTGGLPVTVQEVRFQP